MKKTSLIAIFSLVLLFTSCADKKAFMQNEVKSSSSLVYIYMADDSFMDGTFKIYKYKVLINGNSTGKSLKIGEYVKFDMKPNNVAISLSREDLEVQTLKLNLQAGNTYYLKGQSHSNRFKDFTLELMDADQGLNEISSTTSTEEISVENKVFESLVESEKDVTSKMSEDEINAMIEKKLKAMSPTTPVNTTQPLSTTTSTSATGSKLDDIRNAYEMKKQGVLTEEEFLKMKAEILAK